MSPNEPIVLDACVLVPRLLCDLLLRLAEVPALYLPRWSDVVLQEVGRNQVRLGLSESRARSWQAEVARHFPEARVADYEALLERCGNSPEDRHVLAAAIQAEAKTLVTFNLRDFSQSALAPWGIIAIHPSAFLLGLYADAPEVVVLKLSEMAREERTLASILNRLRLVVPSFATQVADDLGLSLG